LLSKSFSVDAEGEKYYKFENPGKVRVVLSSSDIVDVYLVLAADIADPGGASESDVENKAEKRWDDVTTLNHTVRLSESHTNYYIFIFNDDDINDVTCTLQIVDDSEPASWWMMILFCLCLLIPVVLFILFLVGLVMAIKKMNARTDKIQQQAKSSKPAQPPPAQPMQQPQQAPPGQFQQQAPPMGVPTPSAMGPKTTAQQIFQGDSFRVDMKIMHVGYSYYIYDAWERKIAFAFMKPLKLKEDIRIFTDDSKTNEIMSIQQEQVMDFMGKFDVWDSQSRQFLGLLNRKAAKSFLRDTWSIKNYNRQDVGEIKEDSQGMAIVRRFMPFGNFIPNASFIKYQGSDVAVIREKFRILIKLLSGWQPSLGVTVMWVCSACPTLL